MEINIIKITDKNNKQIITCEIGNPFFFHKDDKFKINDDTYTIIKQPTYKRSKNDGCKYVSFILDKKISETTKTLDALSIWHACTINGNLCL